jgi:8-oxo-dGTP pyrophosphatase MutT (NUDIX family)
MIPELPDDLPLRERDVVRVVVQDAHGDVLLFHAKDGAEPDVGMWWELPGGGLDPGETYAAAAVRELREETGIQVDVAAIGPPLWRRTASFRYRNVRHLQHEVVALVRIDAVAPDIDVAQRLDYERDDYPDFRWWPVADIVAGARFYPGRLAEYLPRLLTGEECDEPFELFS